MDNFLTHPKTDDAQFYGCASTMSSFFTYNGAMSQNMEQFSLS